MSNTNEGPEHGPLVPFDPLDPRPAATIQGRLRLARDRYSKEQFAIRMGGIDPATIWNYESGKTTRLNPRTLRDWVAASDLPGVTLDWLIGDWTVPKGEKKAHGFGQMSADPLVIARPDDLGLALA